MLRLFSGKPKGIQNTLMKLLQSNLHVLPPLISDHLPMINDLQSKTPKFSQSKPYSKRPPPVSDRDHF